MKEFRTGASQMHAILIGAGLTLNLLLATLTLWGGLPIHELTGLGIAEIVEYWTAALMIALSLTLIASLMIRTTASSKPFFIGATICCVLLASGCGLLFAGRSLVSIIFSGICTGAGLGLSCILWQEQLSTLSETMYTRIPFIALAASSALYLLIATICSNISQLVVTILCIIATLCLLIASQKIHQEYLQKSGGNTASNQQFKTITEDAFLPQLWKPIVCTAAMSALVLLTRFPALSFVTDPNLVNISSHIVILVVAVVIIIGQFGLNKSLSFKHGQSIVTIYYATFPIIATALLALLLSGSSMAVPVAALAYAGFAILVVTLMPTSIVLAHEGNIRAVHVYGILLGSVYIAGVAVTTLGNNWIFVAETEPQGIIALVSVLTMYVLAISVFLLSDTFTRRIVKHEKVPQGSTSSAPDGTTSTLKSLASAYGLTDREEDILQLIIRGRDAYGIASQLHISVNTVRSHSKSIYRKLDIHSKQELLDLIERIEVV